jgi:predicted metalloprotease with PDZ domain
VSDLDDNARSQFKVPEKVKGALVTSVEEDSASDAAGLKAGDVITEINRKPVRNADDAIKLTENAQDSSTRARLEQGRQPLPRCQRRKKGDGAKTRRSGPFPQLQASAGRPEADNKDETSDARQDD